MAPADVLIQLDRSRVRFDAQFRLQHAAQVVELAQRVRPLPQTRKDPHQPAVDLFGGGLGR